VQKAAAAGPQEVRLAALAALAQMGDASTTRLLIDTALADDTVLAQAARDSLLRTRVEGVDGVLTTRLDQASSHERIVLLDLLGQRGVAAATAAVVVKLVGDPADELRLAAVRALGRVGSTEQFPVLLGCLQAAKAPQETAVVQDAMRALSSRATEPNAYAGKLRDCLPQASLTSHCFVLELIGQVGGREAQTIVAAHARDARPEMQDAATRALGNWMSVDAAPVLLDLAKTLRDAKLKTRALRGYLRIARQLDLPIDRRLEMCEEAFALAERDEEKRLGAETADAIVQRAGSAAQKARGKALSAKVPH
jgi:HEAT repeat protein